MSALYTIYEEAVKENNIVLLISYCEPIIIVRHTVRKQFFLLAESPSLENKEKLDRSRLSVYGNKQK